MEYLKIYLRLFLLNIYIMCWLSLSLLSFISLPKLDEEFERNSTASLSIVLLHLTGNVYLSQGKRKRLEICPQNRLNQQRLECACSFLQHDQTLNWSLFWPSAAPFRYVLGFAVEAVASWNFSCFPGLSWFLPYSFLSRLLPSLFSLRPGHLNLYICPYAGLNYTWSSPSCLHNSGWECWAFLEQELLAEPSSSVSLCVCNRLDFWAVKSFHSLGQRSHS